MHSTISNRWFVTFLLGIFLLIPSGVFAQTPAAGTTPPPAATSNSGTPPAGKLGTGNYVDPNGKQCTGGETQVTAGNNILTCIQLNPVAAVGNAVVKTATDALENILYFIMTAAGYLLGLVGVLFNWIVVITVFQYAVYFGNSAGMLIAWGILRDVGNIMLLFGFIFMGVLMILDLHSFDARKAIPRLLIFAVLLNFSLFASEAIVDTANVLSAAFYKQAGQTTLGTVGNSPCNQLANPVGCSAAQATGVSANGTNVGIAGVIIADSGVDTSFKVAKPTDSNNPGGTMLVYVGLTIFMLIVMMLLLAAAIMFFIRAVVLTFLLVVSPLGFAGLAIPTFQPRAQAWLHQLITNAFFAPIFLLLVFVGLKVMEAVRMAAGGGSTSLADALTSPNAATSNIGGVLIVFGLTIGFMIAALTYAKSSGAAGASFATNFAQKTVRGVVMAPTRATGFVARRTAGRASLGLADNIRGSKFGRTGMGRFAAGIADRGANASYEFGASKGAQKGYKGIVDKSVKARKDYVGSLKQTPEEAAKQKALEPEKRGNENWLTGEGKKKLDKDVTTQEGKNKNNADQRKLALAAQQGVEVAAAKEQTDQQKKVDDMQKTYDELKTRMVTANNAVSAQNTKYIAAQRSGDLTASAKEGALLASLQNTQSTLGQQGVSMMDTIQTESNVLATKKASSEREVLATQRLKTTQMAEAANDERTLQGFKDVVKREVDQRTQRNKEINDIIKGTRTKDGQGNFGIDGDSAKRKFAENLRNGPNYFPGSANYDSDHRAAKAILDDLDKNENARLMDALKGVTDATKKNTEKSGDGDKDGGGGGSH